MGPATLQKPGPLLPGVQGDHGPPRRPAVSYQVSAGLFLWLDQRNSANNS